MSDPIIDITTIKYYFENLQITHVDIESFQFGDSQRIIGAQKSVIDYPCLFLEVPNFKPSGNGASFELGCFIAFAVISNVPPDDYAKQDDQLQKNLAITIELLNRIRQDARSTPFLFSFDINSAVVDPIASYLADNNYGWRTEFQLVLELEMCVDEGKWTDL